MGMDLETPRSTPTGPEPETPSGGNPGRTGSWRWLGARPAFLRAAGVAWFGKALVDAVMTWSAYVPPEGSSKSWMLLRFAAQGLCSLVLVMGTFALVVGGLVWLFMRNDRSEDPPARRVLRMGGLVLAGVAIRMGLALFGH